MGVSLLITGPKHAGKSSAGRALAELRGGLFIDLDDLVEAQSGKSPRELFRLGSGLFREAETAALGSLIQEAAPEPFRVIAAGGGLADNPAALRLLWPPLPSRPPAGWIAAYLAISPQSAWERIRAAGELPPFLEGPDPESLHRELHLRRGACYRELAAISIEAEGLSPKETALELDRRLGELLLLPASSLSLP